MPLTPDEWLNRLTAQMDFDRARLRLLRSYMDGNAPLPEGADGCRDAYQQFQRKSRTNFGELIVDAVVERMTISGFRVGGSHTDDDTARRIWKRWRGKVGSADVHRDMVGLSTGYVMVQPSEAGAVITYERPEQAIAEVDPLNPNITRAGLKVYRDAPERFDRAFLHLPGAVFVYQRAFDADPARAANQQPVLTASGGWELVDVRESGQNFVSLFPFANRDSKGEFETHLDVLDRINWGILQRLVITAMQAYRQRGVKGDMPDEDEDGNEIDYAEMFRPGPGSLWRLPEGAELWESQSTDLTPILSGSKDDITHLAAVTRTPMAALMPDGANQTAEGASFAREGLVSKTNDRVNRATPVWDAVMGAALAIEQGMPDPIEDVATQWLPIERRTLAERADAASKATDIPWRTRMTDIWQYPADQVDDMEEQRERDAALAPRPIVVAAEQTSAPPSDAAEPAMGTT
mgnify:CR=1 FL=1